MEKNILIQVLHLCNFFVTTLGHFQRQDGCPSPHWSIDIPRRKCLKFYPEFHDFAHAEQLCKREGSNIPYMDIDVDVTSAFQYLHLTFTNSSFQFWTRRYRDNNEIKISKRTTDEEKNCDFMKLGGDWNISRHTRKCQEETAVLCEYNLNDSTNKLFSKDFYVLDTQDLVAIGAGVFILAAFCFVVLMDILKHTRSPDQKMADGARV
ncbi:uncharacterized protein LOC117335821 [Pecten maximus]|uniref:uncharacterized protein LOC117335821 n=1 Tax=Pecten maximus TaxID=6579 RepID=UPI00145892A7|nr:uncharacterized protein LOC117335821 [Pecten maximus]